jgi:hypothetical protein
MLADREDSLDVINQFSRKSFVWEMQDSTLDTNLPADMYVSSIHKYRPFCPKVNVSPT